MNLATFRLEPHQSKTVKPGDRFGRLVVLATGKLPGTYKYKAVYQCDCGAVRVARLATIRETGDCLCTCGHDRTKPRTRHGLWKDPLYTVWWHMLRRCENPKEQAFPNYGGRGISVCERWHELANFHADMAPSYKPGLSIERKDNNKDYTPDNCRWATPDEQMKNRRNNIVVTMDGETMILKDWCRRFGVNYHSVYHRITQMGWEPEQALRTPFLTSTQARVLVRPSA